MNAPNYAVPIKWILILMNIETYISEGIYFFRIFIYMKIMTKKSNTKVGKILRIVMCKWYLETCIKG